ncbi:hypothetical protein PENSPDRAFT_755247 [Peniophora sp. CONT]|nr:hypothetical protein PENSPDRAFT_755247 [Peniophora sp. CONT]
MLAIFFRALRQTCKQLHSLVTSSTTLQYTLSLAANGMLDGPSSIPLTTAERLALLRTRHAAWRTLSLGLASASIHLPGYCQASDFVGGYFGRCFSHNLDDVDSIGTPNLTLVTLPSRSPTRELKVETHDVGVHMKDFTLDPSQDLLALLDMLGTDSGTVRIHLRQLNDPTASHPGAGAAMLEAEAELDILECTLDIAGDVLALYVRHNTPQVIIFNWRTGEEVVNMIPPAHPVPSESFSLLSPRTFLVAYPDPDAIRLFSFTSPSPSKIASVTAIMRLPPTVPGASYFSISAVTSHWLAAAPPGSAHFPSNNHRVCTLNYRVSHAHGWVTLSFIVRARTFGAILRVAQARLASGEPADKMVWDWPVWLTPFARVLALPQLSRSNPRYVHGARMLAKNGYGGLELLDFDVPASERRDSHPTWELCNTELDDRSFGYFEGEPSELKVQGLLDTSAMSEFYGDYLSQQAAGGEGDGDDGDRVVGEAASAAQSAHNYGDVSEQKLTSVLRI